ncbi:uncharacterized protein LOC7467947 isoform X2 [Populus trichocarpa]|uniref:uncharacterized protein LOC7467947 isoform X2 n=1 Tax=Populus trichocarpa TaxID=3694 RepID=UPI000D187873|nr:uncharacterized protein LOC7467947 isoform X2 [Populus trichocarpa]|eukprot:XP_024443298.1 coiled-coil domain-containing protein R3HCC1L isoform X2 [Populus trichocarpa]
MERVKAQEEDEEQSNQNWSETVEDLVTAGDTEGAITLLETEVSRLETLNPSEAANLQLVSALTELAKLYSSKHFSLKSDELLFRASFIKQRSSGDVESVEKEDEISKCNAVSNDDWEAIADHAPDELLSPQSLPSVSNICLEDAKVQTSKRRGRGPFTYKKHELYSDRQSDATLVDDVDDEDLGRSTQNTELTNSKYGTHHVLVLADFPPSMRTTDLEKLFEDFKDRGFVIRWINDTAALAVFQTPSIALEARNHIQCSFTVRILDADDELMGSIPTKDLEPPRQRPKTSARTAQRLIAHGMGLKLPMTFGSRELKNQEETRKNRIVTRQKMKDDAWGDD